MRAVFVLLPALLIFAASCNYDLSPRMCSSDADCSDGFVCTEKGECRVCGGASLRPCCRDNACGDGFVCMDGVCHDCGARRTFCCADGSCNDGLTCGEDGLCRGCGEIDEPCCDGSVCNSKANLKCVRGICRAPFQFSEYDTHELASATSSRG